MFGGGASGAAVTIDENPPEPPKPLAQANVSDVKKSARGEGVKRWIQVALHWSEYVAGKWSAPTSTGFGGVGGFSSRTAFDPGSVFVHSSNVYDAQGQEAGVQIHLTGGDGADVPAAWPQQPRGVGQQRAAATGAVQGHDGPG